MYHKKTAKEQYLDVYNHMVIHTSKGEAEQYKYESVKRNYYSFRIIIAFIVMCQLYNIVRVLYYSKSGLGTLNNRIYFYFYITMIISCILGLVLEKVYRNKLRIMEFLYVSTAFYWQLWHLLLNYYDLSKDPFSGVDTYLIAVFTCAVFLQTKLIYSLTMNVITYIIFVSLTYNILSVWNAMNLFITILLATLISSRMYGYLVNEIKQKNEMQIVNKALEKERLDLHMSLRKYEIIMEYTNDIIFGWDIEQDIIEFSKNVQEKLPIPRRVMGAKDWLKKAPDIYEEDKQLFIEKIKTLGDRNREGDITIRIKTHSEVYECYHLRAFLQCGLMGEPLYMMGTLIEEKTTKKHFK